MSPNVAAGKEILIAVMGVTGAGKSYFIREVSGNSGVKVSGGLHSCTSKVESYSFQHAGATITLVDTPGFSDTTRSDTEVLAEICDWTSKTYRGGRLLSGIIYLHRITDVRMDASAVKNLRMFQKLCGHGALRNVFLTTTQWSNVIDPADGERRESALCEERNFWGILLEKGASLQRFHGTRESGLELINKLMPNQPAALDIQDQIVTQNRTVVETDAGQWINAELIEQEKRYKEEIEALERERQAAINEKDDEMKELLAEEQAKAQEKLEKAADEKKLLAEMHAEEMRKREEREERRRREDLERAAAEQNRLAELHAAQMREQQERAAAEAKQLQEIYERNLREQREEKRGGIGIRLGPIEFHIPF